MEATELDTCVMKVRDWAGYEAMMLLTDEQAGGKFSTGSVEYKVSS